MFKTAAASVKHRVRPLGAAEHILTVKHQVGRECQASAVTGHVVSRTVLRRLMCDTHPPPDLRHVAVQLRREGTG